MEPSSPAASAVMSNDDLLIQILLRLPATSLFWFKYVSKGWLSLITDSSFIRRRSQLPDLDPPSGLFIAQPKSKWKLQYEYDLVPLDIRIPDKRSAAFNFGSEASSDVEILQSCNGLILCCSGTEPFMKYYVCNPTTNVFKMLPQCCNVNSCSDKFCFGTRIAFDPTKSPHYKVVSAVFTRDDAGFYTRMQIYSSETCNWTVCGDWFEDLGIVGFGSGIYWNGSIHWLNIGNKRPLHWKLDIADPPKLI